MAVETTDKIGAIDKEQQLKIKKLVKKLEAIRGRHTELVSVYVPAGYSLTDVSNQLKDEQGTASNIKSKNTRKNVLDALEKIIQHLRIFRQTPPNGLVVFCGNVSPVEGKDDIVLWSFEPPARMGIKLYWCDQVFVLDPLKEMVREREVYGIIVLDAKDASVGLLMGKAVQTLKNLDSRVPSKTVKGGMSQGRYDRLREDAIHEFLTKVGEAANGLLLKQQDMKGIIIGGPGPIKERFAKGDYLNYQLRNKLLGVKDTGYTGEYGLQELVERSEDLLKEAAVMEERELLGKFFLGLQKDGPVTYGVEEVKRTLAAGAVDTLLISESFEWLRVKYRCQCGNEEQKDMQAAKFGEEGYEKKLRCGKCGGEVVVTEKRDLVEILVEDAEKVGTKVELVSTDTREGEQFYELGGIGALLRFKLS